MSDHSFPSVQRRCDVAVVGASAAGLAAALQLARQLRSVIVIDAGDPRNAPAAHMHGYLGREGTSPAELTAIGREEVRSYGAEVIDGRATDVTLTDDGLFQVHLTGGHSVVARRVLAATGLLDELPDIDGLADHWGVGVIHCPFCHGFEVRDRRIVQVVTHPLQLHPAALYHRLSDRLTVVLHEGVDADAGELDILRAAGVPIIATPVARVTTANDGSISGVQLADGRTLNADAVAIGPRFRARCEPFASLGLAPTEHPTGLGDYVESDQNGATSVPGLYVAGNVTNPMQQVLHAAADGSFVATMISFSLAHDDLEAAVRPGPNEAEWDHRYSTAQVWSANPNGTLAAEVDGLATGRALDVGCGKGGDAIWLAEQGWTVTASDISQRALDRVAAAAHERNLDIDCVRADANRLDAFESGVYDLVSAQYASIPRTPDGRGRHNLIDAVAVGGTLIVVSHDAAPMRQPIDTDEHSRPFDVDAYQRAEEFAIALAGSEDWVVLVDEVRARPAGSATAAHHHHDVVFRAQRQR